MSKITKAIEVAQKMIEDYDNGLVRNFEEAISTAMREEVGVEFSPACPDPQDLELFGIGTIAEEQGAKEIYLYVNTDGKLIVVK